MKITFLTVQILFWLSLFFCAGCETSKIGTNRIEKSSKTITDCNEVFAYAGYSPVKIDILPFTEYSKVDSSPEDVELEVYVSLSDTFGSQIKSPGIFRFELYKRVPRSAEPKGERIDFWPDINLTDITENESHWRDFLRAYEFSLPLKSQTNQNCILQATCICPNGKRLSTEFPVMYTK